jgi:hypothetical protein
MQNTLNTTSKVVIDELIEELTNLKHKQSNVEVVWGLEQLNNDSVLKKGADKIRKSL